MPVFECPSLFPLPPLVAGTQHGAQTLPTHVHKWGNVHHFGVWVDGTPGVGEEHAGLWTTMRGATVNVTNCTRYSTAQTDEQCHYYDRGAFSAAKDFWDPVHGRRINWGWASLPDNSVTLPPTRPRICSRTPKACFTPASPSPLPWKGWWGAKQPISDLSV